MEHVYHFWCQHSKPNQQNSSVTLIELTRHKAMHHSSLLLNVAKHKHKHNTSVQSFNPIVFHNAAEQQCTSLHERLRHTGTVNSEIFWIRPISCKFNNVQPTYIFTIHLCDSYIIMRLVLHSIIKPLLASASEA